MDYDKWKQEVPEEEPEHECSECGKPMETDKTYCSDACFKAGQL